MQHHTYQLHLKNTENGSQITHKSQNGQRRNFSAPVTTGGLTKIYVLTNPAGEVVYVGHTIRSIGQIALRKHTPYNYKWMKSGKWKELNLHIFLPELPEDCEDAKLYGEAIEAEVVYQVRQQTGAWPIGQNEIHFNNTFGHAATQEAVNIYQRLT